MQQFSKSLMFAGAASAGLVLAACAGDSTGVNGRSAAQLAFSTGASASLAAAPVTNGGHTLDLSGVTVTISRAELKRASTDACPGDDDEQDDDHPQSTASTAACGELKIGPVTVNLPLDGSLVSLPANTIPAGTYREFELRVSRVELKGTFDGKAFDDTIAVNAKSEVHFSTPLVVTDGAPTSITVNVPVKNWLVNADGSLVDATKLSSNPSLLGVVKNRIRSSFRAFEDRDHDGRDDHDKDGHG